MSRYCLTVVWSEEDEAFIASNPELPGCVADGSTVEEAVSNLGSVREDWMDSARLEGWPIPSPMVFRKSPATASKSAWRASKSDLGDGRGPGANTTAEAIP